MSDKKIIFGLIVLMIILLGGGGYVLKTFLSDDSPRAKKSSVAPVTLVKPPPVTEKEKPPEREPVKETQKRVEVVDGEKAEFVDARMDNEPQSMASDSGPAGPPGSVQDNTPAGDRLGLDTEGKAGSDAFGLVARKGGRSILSGSGPGTPGGTGTGTLRGSGSGKQSLLNKYGWYTQIVKTEVSKKVQKHMEDNGGIPKGKLETVVRVSVDDRGAIVQSQIIGSSGNHDLDKAVKQSIADMKLSEPPPEGMPRTMIIKVTSYSS